MRTDTDSTSHVYLILIYKCVYANFTVLLWCNSGDTILLWTGKCFTLEGNAQSEEERSHNEISATLVTDIVPMQMSDPTDFGSIKAENGEELIEGAILSNNSEEDGRREIKSEAVNSSPEAPSSLGIRPTDTG